MRISRSRARAWPWWVACTGLVACHPDPGRDSGKGVDSGESADTDEWAWVETIPAGTHIAYHLEGSDLELDRHLVEHVACHEAPWLDSFQLDGFIGQGQWTTTVVCGFRSVSGRIHPVSLDPEGDCPDGQGWMISIGEMVEEERMTWTTLPESEVEVVACWMDLFTSEADVVARFQCPWLRHPSHESTLALTDGTLRCTLPSR